MLGKMIVVDGNNFDQLLPTVLFSIWVPQSSTGFTPSSFINLLKKCLELVLPQLPALSITVRTLNSVVLSQFNQGGGEDDTGTRGEGGISDA